MNSGGSGGEYMPVIRSRPAKLNHADTVLYEIFMLRFSAGRLLREQWEEPQDAWVYLETFLLHYRNLIEFLGKYKNFKEGDVLLTNIWGLLNESPPKELDTIHAGGKALLQEYEEVEDRISRYLAHITENRTEAKDWFIDVMSNKIEPLLAQIVPLLQAKSANPLVKPVHAVSFAGSHPANTSVYTPTANVIFRKDTDTI
jgi:hypothetical protein